ncbi:MAG: hypothetical protein ACM359_08565, partial [Bacillota bacterium]
RMSLWSYAASLAAAAILVLNLSLAASGEPFATRLKVSPQQTRVRADAIHQVVPELSSAEACRMAVVLSASENLVAAPLPRGASAGSVLLTNTPLEP